MLRQYSYIYPSSILLPKGTIRQVLPYSNPARAASEQAETRVSIGWTNKHRIDRAVEMPKRGTNIASVKEQEKEKNISGIDSGQIHKNVAWLNCPPSKEYWIKACLPSRIRLCVEKKLLDDFLQIRDKRFKKRYTINWVEKTMESL